MKLTIYDIEPEVVTKIDVIAENKGLSRSAYLKDVLESLSFLDSFNEYEEKYLHLIKKLGTVIENNTEALKNLENIIMEDF